LVERWTGRFCRHDLEALVGSLLAALTTIIVTVLAAALAAPYILDWNQYRDMFEAQASKMVGRAVRVDGNVGLTILPIPEVRLRGVRIADERGDFKRPFAEVENFTMVLSLSPLFSGTIDAREIILDQPLIRFQLDGNGEGNWAAPGGGASSRDVVLQNVTIKDGIVEYRNAPDATATRIDQISGSFSADSLSGPFRFNGVGAIGRDKRELKFSASRAQRDNSMRLKASLGAASGGSLYQLDGELKNFGGAMQYTGPVLARLMMGGTSSVKKGQEAEAANGKAIELRAASTITLQDARLQDIALTVTENDRPQTFTGSAYAAWGEQPRLDLSVQTAFLDIDQMIGAKDGKSDPMAAVAALPQIFQGWAFEPRQGKITATVQQANLGGDVIEGLTFSAVHNREYWQVEKLEARLPGDAPLSIRGVLQPGEQIGFTGEFNLSGRYLSRMLRWAAPSLGAVDTGDAQNFTLKGGMTFADQRITFRRGSGELGSSSFSGDLAYDFSENSKLVLTLQSDRLDLRAVYGGNPFAADSPAEAHAAAEPDPKAVKTSLMDALRSVFKAKQSQITLRIAQLTMPDLEARDVRSVFRYENGTLDIRELNLATTDGLSVKADGALTNFDTSPNGAVNLAVNAPSTASLANLAKLFGLESFGSAAQRRMDALAPLRINGKLNGNSKDHLLNLTLAGNAAGSELTLNGRFDGEFSALSQARLDLNGTIANADGRRLIAQLAPEVPMTGDASRNGPGVLKISVLGALKGGLASKLELRTPEAEGRFEGQIAMADSAPWGMNGDLWLRAGQASTALSMLRLSPGGTPVSGELDLRAGISKQDNKFQVANVSLQIGGETISGSATVDTAGERPVANVDVRATSVMLPKLAAYLVDWDRKDISAGGDGNVLTGNVNPWPNQSFAFRSFSAMEGSLKVKAPALTLTDGLALANAQLDASLKNGTLTVETLKGQLYGGNFSGSGTLAAGDGKAVLKGQLKLDKADLARLTIASDGKPLAKAAGELRLAFNGEGFSPRGLLTVLQGKGRVKINKGTLFGLSPAVLGQAADAYLTEEIPQQQRLTARITRDLRPAAASIPFRGFIAPLVLKDGVIEVRRAAFKSADYKAAANLFVDLSTNRIDSEWNVAFRGKTKNPIEGMPPIRLVYAGALAGFTTLQPQLSTQEYERFLSMRRMDRDMERLEKLNRTPGALQPSITAAPRDPLPARPPASASPAVTPAAPQPPVSATVTAPVGLPTTPTEAIGPTRPTAAPGPTPAQPGLGWATGVEAAKEPPASDTGAATDARKPRAFNEDEIRRILEEQRKTEPQPASPPKGRATSQQGTGTSDLTYQTQTYSQSASDDTDADSAAQAERPAQTPVPPPPVKKGAAPAPQKPAPARQPQSIWDVFR
jgi:uncharacterized protein involved in outer membrane biogenesis